MFEESIPDKEPISWFRELSSKYGGSHYQLTAKELSEECEISEEDAKLLIRLLLGYF